MVSSSGTSRRGRLIFDARCVLVLELEFEAQCDDRSPMCSVVALLEAEASSIGCCR